MNSSRNSFEMVCFSRFIILQSVVTRYLFVQKVVNCCILIKIANYYGVSLDFLVGMTDNRFNSYKGCLKDLNKFLQQSEIIFDGDTYKLTDEDRDLILKALEVAFLAVKRGNKHNH